MAYVTIEQGIDLYYEEKGTGRPVIFLHGVWMSSRFFEKQQSFFAENYRSILLDFRSHGRSTHVHHGNTVATYAKDLHTFIEKLDLKGVVLVGWSMGAFVVWDYIKQFGSENIHSTIIVDELASDFKWPDFEIGAFDIATLSAFMTEIQTNRSKFLTGFLTSMFKDELKPDEAAWMLEEVTKMPESIASAILFDQSIVDYREFLPSITIPTLLCFGREEKVIPVAAGEYLKGKISGSQLEIFENSCHCPFIEETERFNEVVDRFIQTE